MNYFLFCCYKCSKLRFIESFKHAAYLFLVLFIYLLISPQVLGFGEYIEEVYAAYEQHKMETMVSNINARLHVEFLSDTIQISIFTFLSPCSTP